MSSVPEVTGPNPSSPSPSGSRRWRLPAAMAIAVAVVAAGGFFLRHRAEARTNHEALASTPKDVTTVLARAATYQAEHRYVGTLRPWTEAKVGPQFVSAYVSTVLVRPGAVVALGQVLATLDCRDASARSRSIEQQARAMQSQQVALAAQAQRVTGLLDGGFIAANDVQQRTAESDAQGAKLESERAQLNDAQLSVRDCILRAPFTGDVGERSVDPGAFVRPGDSLVTVIDRSVVRLVVDVPESDFSMVDPGTEVRLHMLALDRTLTAHISRRSPSADPTTRTVHIEVDLPDPEHHIPVNTTAELLVGAGKPLPATQLPLIAADLAQGKASLFVVEGQVAHGRTLPVLGEAGGDVYFDPQALADGAAVVLEGRAALIEGDRVSAKVHANAADAGGAAPPPAAEPGAR